MINTDESRKLLHALMDIRDKTEKEQKQVFYLAIEALSVVQKLHNQIVKEFNQERFNDGVKLRSEAHRGNDV